MVNVAINGFGRIGRQAFQHALKDKKIKIVAINDLTDNNTLAYLLKYDSVYGRFDGKVTSTKDSLTVNGKKIPSFSEKDPEKLPWKKYKVNVVLECTGFFTDREGASKHLKAGARKVVISAPGKNSDITIAMGVNEKKYDKNKHNIISNASCTTNALAPLVKVLNDKLGIIKGLMITTHSYTSSQNLVDGPHKKLRRGRAAAQNIVPTTTGAAIAVTETIPELKGKLNGFALRVPTLCGSIVTLYAHVKKKTSIQEVNNFFKTESKKMKGILKYSEDELVSSDIIRDCHSSIYDSFLTDVIDDLVVVSGWYDNEWGYSHRLIDLAKIV